MSFSEGSVFVLVMLAGIVCITLAIFVGVLILSFIRTSIPIPEDREGVVYAKITSK